VATLQQTIAEKFLAKLQADQSLDDSKLDQLRKLMEEGKKLKADDFINIFTVPAEGEVK